MSPNIFLIRRAVPSVRNLVAFIRLICALLLCERRCLIFCVLRITLPVAVTLTRRVRDLLLLRFVDFIFFLISFLPGSKLGIAAYLGVLVLHRL